MNPDPSTVREWDRLVARTPGSDLDEPVPAPATAASSSRRFHATAIAQNLGLPQDPERHLRSGPIHRDMSLVRKSARSG
jgi:hypothetical protein